MVYHALPAGNLTRTLLHMFPRDPAHLEFTKASNQQQGKESQTKKKWNSGVRTKKADHASLAETVNRNRLYSPRLDLFSSWLSGHVPCDVTL